MIRIPLFVFDGIEFKTAEEIWEYDNSLYENNKDEEEFVKKREEFGEKLKLFIFTMLHSLTLTKEIPKPAIPNENGDEDWVGDEFQNTIMSFITEYDWLYSGDDLETEEYDLESSWATVVEYFNSPFEEHIAYGIAYTQSPYCSYKEFGFSIFAARKVPVLKFEYKPI